MSTNEHGSGSGLTNEDFSEEEHRAVDNMAAPLIRQSKMNKGFKGKRNRDAWLRMNRPSKMDAIDAGATKIYAFLERCVMEETTGTTGTTETNDNMGESLCVSA